MMTVLALVQVALVGAPNVGKSSLVQILSSGQPEICDYPFTTRSIKMGHFYVDGRRHQVPTSPYILIILPHTHKMLFTCRLLVGWKQISPFLWTQCGQWF